MKWVAEGMEVFVWCGRSAGTGCYERAKVITAAGNLANVFFMDQGTAERRPTLWVKVDDLVSQQQVAADAARRLAGGGSGWGGEVA